MKKLLFVAVLLFGICFSSFAQQKAKKEVKISAIKVEKLEEVIRTLKQILFVVGQMLPFQNLQSLVVNYVK